MQWFLPVNRIVGKMVKRNPYDSSSFPHSLLCSWRRGWAHQMSTFESSRRNHQSRWIYQTWESETHFKENVFENKKTFCLIYLKKLKASDPDAQVVWV